MMYDMQIMSMVFLTVLDTKSWMVKMMMSSDGTNREVYFSREMEPMTIIIESMNMQI